MASASIIGNVGREPEVKESRGGNLTRFSVAVNERVGGEETTTWFNVVAFGKLGETAANYLTKGKQVFVEGRLQVKRYKKDGQERQSVEILANKLVFLGSKSDGAREDDGGVRRGGGGRSRTPETSRMLDQGGNKDGLDDTDWPPF